MILDWLGFILLAWLITGLITGIAEVLLAPKGFVLSFCKRQEEYKVLQLNFTDNSIYNIMRVVIVLSCTIMGFTALRHYYKTVKHVKKYKEEQNS